jgi:hypothetical protein
MSYLTVNRINYLNEFKNVSYSKETKLVVINNFDSIHIK